MRLKSSRPSTLFVFGLDAKGADANHVCQLVAHALRLIDEDARCHIVCTTDASKLLTPVLAEYLGDLGVTLI